MNCIPTIPYKILYFYISIYSNFGFAWLLLINEWFLIFHFINTVINCCRGQETLNEKRVIGKIKKRLRKLILIRIELYCVYFSTSLTIKIARANNEEDFLSGQPYRHSLVSLNVEKLRDSKSGRGERKCVQRWGRSGEITI